MSTSPGDHVSDSDVDRLVHGRLEAAAARRVLQHLARCPDCRARPRPGLAALCGVLDGEEALRPLPESDFDEAVERAGEAIPGQQARWRDEESWRARLLAGAGWRAPFQIERTDPARLFPGVDLEDVPGRPYVEALLAWSAGERYRDTEAMEEFALLAVMVAKSLGKRPVDRGRYTSLETVDLQARAAAELANAYRLNHRIDLADEVLREALELWRERGSRDLLIEARLLDVTASLRLDQRRTGRAFALLEEVAKRYQEVGEIHLSGRALISKGMATYYDGRPLDAAALFQEGLARIDPRRDPQLVVAAKHNFLETLLAAEHYQEASAFFLQSGLAQAFEKEPLNLLKLRGLEGRLLAGLGQLRPAESILADVKQKLHSAGRRYVAGIVCLELAAVYLRQGELQAAEAQAAEALATFGGLGVSYEAEKAVAALAEACRLRRATVGLALRVIFFVQRVERDPALRWRAFTRERAAN